jgi:hypothetical protein
MTDDTTDEERAYQQRLADFRRKLSAMAIAVMQKKHLRPLDVAGSFIGCGHGVLEDEFGKELCNQYFAGMVEEMLPPTSRTPRPGLDS